MKRWTCKVCGYTHNGDEAPERCPQCGASKAQFNQEGAKRGCSLSLIAIIMVLSIPFCIIYACRSPVNVDNSPIDTLDLNRYLGKWYEIARFDHDFEQGMTHCTATYSLKDDGNIEVTNQGMKEGKWKTSEGNAKLTQHPGILRVSFFGPFYSDYRILMLAPDYSYALVGGDSDHYLWILSRTPQLPKSTLDMLVGEAKKRGYETKNLVWVEQ